MNRRQFLHGIGSCSVCMSANAKRVAAQTGDLPPFCSLDSSFDIDRYRRMSRSGNSRLDKALIVELRNLIKVFPINPGFQYIDDTAANNAFALDRSIIKGTTGTVLFGVNLFEAEMQSDFGGAAVAGIAAHEGAHIMQFFSDFGRRLAGNTARAMELHADFMAGFYFAETRRTERSLVSFGRSLFSKGDFDFNSRQHHGTPDERLNAMRAGYDQHRLGRDLSQAIDVGIDHVSA